MTRVAIDYLPEPPSDCRTLGVVALAGAAQADLRIGLPSLAGGLLLESWRSDRPVLRRGAFGPLRYATAEGLCFGTIAAPIAPHGTAEAAFSAYRAMFEAIDREACPHLLRVSNYVPSITEIEAGEERYRAFNRGRQAAFAARDRPVTQAPAACGLGCRGDALRMFFLAGSEPGRNIENPRQVSAFHYPERYGATPPAFARATLAAGMLFISGTASIVGHESRHAGDVGAQTDETIRNLDALLAEAGRAGYQLARPDLRLKLYLRHGSDRALAEQRLVAAGFTRPAGILQADICRPELDIEIEAHCPLPEFRNA